MITRSLVAVGMAALLTSGMSAETLVLKGGASVSGTVLAEKAEQFVVDIGYTVLSVPRSAILSITDGSEKVAAPAGASAGGPVAGPGEHQHHQPTDHRHRWQEADQPYPQVPGWPGLGRRRVQPVVRGAPGLQLDPAPPPRGHQPEAGEGKVLGPAHARDARSDPLSPDPVGPRSVDNHQPSRAGAGSGGLGAVHGRLTRTELLDEGLEVAAMAIDHEGRHAGSEADPGPAPPDDQ